MEQIKPSSLEEFNRRMNELTTAYIRGIQNGKFSLYIELDRITQWQGQYDTLEQACDSAIALGCGKAYYTPNTALNRKVLQFKKL